MKVYVVMVNDRHADPEPEVFTSSEAAVEWARRTARRYARSPEDVEESQVDGWLYSARYSCEGDSIWVIEKTVDRKLILREDRGP